MALRHWGFLLGLGALCACSSKTGTGSGGFPAQESGGDTGAGGFVSLLGTGSSGTGANNGDDGGLKTSQVCVGEAHGAEAVPVDMYIMFDHSESMADAIPGTNPPVTWWATAQQAIATFVNNQQAANAHMGVGLQFFPIDGTAPASCTADYSTPAVEIGLLPGNAGALTSIINAEQPNDFTPTGPALQGAINHMKTWGPAHPGRAPVVVLVTDGFPTECTPQEIPDIATIAKTAFTTDPVVRTFVVGFNLGAGGTNLNQIAKAGGTGQATLINNGDIGTQFVNALLGIASTPLQCSFPIPAPDQPPGQPPVVVNTDLVRVEYTPSTSTVSAEVPKVGDLGGCALNANQGWYYDDQTTPKNILICPGTCANFAAGTVSIQLGCKPTIILD